MNALQAASNSQEAFLSSLNGARDKSATEETDSQDRFLTLLVTQLKNQDPLNPLDNAQITSQLAQISTVEGIGRLNATLQALMSGSQDSQAIQAAALVGHGVLVPGAGVSLVDGMALAGADLAQAADEVTVTITDGNGLVVKTLNLGALPAGSHVFGWDGLSDGGAQAANGAYRFSLAARSGELKIDAAPLEFGVVSSVARSARGVSLNVGAQGVFGLADVKQIL